MMNTGAIIQDLIDWIDNHLDSRLDIDTVARRGRLFEVAPAADLQRTYRAALGEYIRAKKLQKSIERLAHSNEPILNVAIALGFDSQQSFKPQLQSASTAGRPASGAGYQPLCCADISSVIRMTGEGQS